MVDELCESPSHWNSDRTLDAWLCEQGVTGLRGVDTRAITQKIRERGTMLGKIVVGDDSAEDVGQLDPSVENVVAKVSVKVDIESIPLPSIYSK